MIRLRLVLCPALAWGALLHIGNSHVIAAESRERGAAKVSRQVTFELTFAHRDLIWFGDPGSPAALLYPRPGVGPIATDFYVASVTEDNQSQRRHYMREARIVAGQDARKVYAFTKQREQIIGTIDGQGRFSPNEVYKTKRDLLPTWPPDASVLQYDSEENALYTDVAVPGPVVLESLDFLPLELSDAKGNAVAGRFAIDFASADNKSGEDAKSSVVSLLLKDQGKSVVLAKAVVPRVFRRSNVELGSFDNQSGAYLPEAVYRAGASDNSNGVPSVTVTFTGEFTPAVDSKGKSLIVVDRRRPAGDSQALPASISIDGNFDDWRNVAGVDDPRGDLVPYLEYVPDVDILEFKVSHDDQHIYLYARVAGQVGRSHPNGGRSYFYAYMDVDQNSGTGFLPTRDDECYFGVDIGDDCEVQFEFVNNAFRKTFYGFCGLGGDDNVLKKQVTIGKSQYGRYDENGVERANYKSEYTYRDGITEITEDLKLGTSDTIRLAVSPDGREVEVASAFSGFLKDSNANPTVKVGQTIDLAAGMECDSKLYPGKTNWAADSTIAIRGYRLNPMNHRAAGKQRAFE
jgi:hypothetical protein